MDIFRRDSTSDQEVPTAGEAAAMTSLDSLSMPTETRSRRGLTRPVSPVAQVPTAMVQNVTSVIKSLDPVLPPPKIVQVQEDRESSRGRKNGRSRPRAPSAPSAADIHIWRSKSKERSTSPAHHAGRFELEAPPPVPAIPAPYRSYAPSIRSVAPSVQSSASGSSNWRSSSSASSVYTSISGGSIRSVSTAATSVSSGSQWRPGRSGAMARPKTNVKDMDGIPDEIMAPPRPNFARKDQPPKASGKGGADARGRRQPITPHLAPHALPSTLDPISEKPRPSALTIPVHNSASDASDSKSLKTPTKRFFSSWVRK